MLGALPLSYPIPLGFQIKTELLVNTALNTCLRHSCSRPKLYAAIRSPIVRALADFDSEK